MKTFRIKERYILEGWTYILAKTEDDALRQLDVGAVDESAFDEENCKWEWDYTDYKSLEEYKK